MKIAVLYIALVMIISGCVIIIMKLRKKNLRFICVYIVLLTLSILFVSAYFYPKKYILPDAKELIVTIYHQGSSQEINIFKEKEEIINIVENMIVQRLFFNKYENMKFPDHSYVYMTIRNSNQDMSFFLGLHMIVHPIGSLEIQCFDNEYSSIKKPEDIISYVQHYV